MGYMMYSIGICDDGINTCSAIEEMIVEYCKKQNIEAEIKVWYTGEKICDYLKQGNHLDVLFLDIELSKLNGIQVGNYIREQIEDRRIQIVYISGKTSYAQRLFKTQPMDFLVKPIEQKNVDDALGLAIKILRKSKDKFEFQNGKNYYNLFFSDIIYFYSEGRKVKIKTFNGIKEFYGKLRDVIKELPHDFIVIHQSYVVNKQYVVKYTYEYVEMRDQTILPISKVHRKNIREIILKER